MTSVIDNYTWYSSKESISHSPFTWENKSDQVYGAKVSSPWQYKNPNDAYEAKAKGSLPERRGEPDSQEWEYEFGDDTVTFTFGGNDSSTATNGEEILRDIIKGSFNYKNGEISGTVDEFVSATWDNDDSGDEEIIMRWVANEPVRFNGLNQLGQTTGRIFQGIAIPESKFYLAGNYKTSNVGFASGFDDNLSLERSELLTADYNHQLNPGWWNSPFSTDLVSSVSISIPEPAPVPTPTPEPTPVPLPTPTPEPTPEPQTEGEKFGISDTKKFNKKSADKITNFNPSTDTLEIDTDSFGIDSSATFAAGKNKKKVKKKLAKQDFDFLYDEKKGGLYFNENGADKGFGEGGIIAILKGAPDLTSGNLEYI